MHSDERGAYRIMPAKLRMQSTVELFCLCALLFFVPAGAHCLGVDVPVETQLSSPSMVVGLNKHFAAAGAKFGVPPRLLKAIGYVETRWQMVRGQTEFEGVPPAFGVMALRGQRLEQGADLAQVNPAAVRTEPRANIFAAAALLYHYAGELGPGCKGLKAWEPALKRYSGISQARSQRYYLREIERILTRGVMMKTSEGAIIASISPYVTNLCL